MKRHRKKWVFMYSHRTKHGTLWFYGKHRWGRRPHKGQFYHYNKALKGFYPNARRSNPVKYAYSKSKGQTGLAGLKAFWGAYRYKKYGLK